MKTLYIILTIIALFLLIMWMLPLNASSAIRASRKDSLIKAQQNWVLGPARSPNAQDGFTTSDSLYYKGVIEFNSLIPGYRVVYNRLTHVDTLHIKSSRLVKLNDSTFVVK